MRVRNYEKLQYPYEIMCRVCFSNKTKDLNLHVFNIKTGINESKTLTKLISCHVSLIL